MIAQVIFFAICAVILLIASVIDYKTRLIPPILPILLAVCGVLFAGIKILVYEQVAWGQVQTLIFGALIGGLFLIIIGLIGNLIFQKEVLGGGDIKLMGGVGSIIGWEKVLMANITGFFLAALIGMVLILLKKIDSKTYIPFAPFLSAGVYISIFAPKTAVDAFINFIL
jgi:leader peptidase (prepilin peptidase)/N-methyltransferase